MSKQFKVEARDGKFIVMVTEPTNRPFWKFWEAKNKTSVARKKDGTLCAYDKQHHAEGCMRILSGAV